MSDYYIPDGSLPMCQKCYSAPCTCGSAVTKSHAGDCTIYAALINGTPLDGICTCGYGWECVRRSDWSKMFSKEWIEAHKPLDFC